MNNTSPYGSGGGIFSAYSITSLNGTTLAGNSASYGGGLYSFGYYTTTVANSTFTGNSALVYRRWRLQRRQSLGHGQSLHEQRVDLQQRRRHLQRL